MIAEDTWQPFETAPRDRPILAYHEKIGMAVVWYRDGFDLPWASPGWRYAKDAFSHWMPLPDIPAGERKFMIVPDEKDGDAIAWEIVNLKARVAELEGRIANLENVIRAHARSIHALEDVCADQVEDLHALEDGEQRPEKPREAR
jgi:hypothetical protein